jgi:hypothetical protein
MANKTSFTPEEWTTLLKSPGMAGLVVVAASPNGPIGAVQESFAIGKVITETKAKGGANELITAIAGDIMTPEGRKSAQAMELFGKSAADIKTAALDTCKRAAAIVAAKSPPEADAFKGWLMQISKAVSEAAKEGGFFGFGGTLVSEAEQAALKETAAALGVTA